MDHPGETVFRGDAFAPPEVTRRYLPEPDFTRAPLSLASDQRASLRRELDFLYGRERSAACAAELERLLQVFHAFRTDEIIAGDSRVDPTDRFTEQDIILITYGDLVASAGSPPLRSLARFLKTFLKGAVNTVHILPFFPSSSDRGFSIIDFEQVDPELGTWDDIDELAAGYRLMFDGVFNHISAKSRWFSEFLADNPDYRDFFIRFSTRTALGEDHRRLILRPRASDLLTAYPSLSGEKWVWTTFSPDQIDLNFHNEQVLLKIIEVLLTYVRRGADIIRIDAVTYLWWELGTSCAFLEQTHALVRLFRAVLDAVAPRVALVTESNIPHTENISYFGDGTDEAQMVYNFALPPLVLYSFLRGDCRALTAWARGLETPSNRTCFFNILDSHDGIPLLPVRDILPCEETEWMIDQILHRGGFITNRHDGEGNLLPYEMNITWFSALKPVDAPEGDALTVRRYVASRAVGLVLAGVPGIYLPSLFGSKNDLDAVLTDGSARSINRRTIDAAALLQKCLDRTSTTHAIVTAFARLIEKRIGLRALHPNGSQRIVPTDPAVFTVRRTSPDGSSHLLSLINVTDREVEISLSSATADGGSGPWSDALSDLRIPDTAGELRLTLAPYQVVWLTRPA